jgi:hypothetical protein
MERPSLMQRSMVARSAGVVVVLLTLLLISPPTTSAEAQVQISATMTPGVFEFRATGFRGNEAVSTWLTGPSQQVLATDYYKTRDGQVTFQLRMPRHLEPGRWAITIHGLESDREAIGFFDVPVRGPDATLNVNQASGPPGTIFAFAGTSFQAGETVSYWLTGPDGRVYEGGYAEANSEGRVDFSHETDEDTQLGRWLMSAYGLTSDRLGIVAFVVS